MGFIQIFTRFLGDPILAAALVVGGILLFAGLGSLSQSIITQGRTTRILAVGLSITVLVLAYTLVLPWTFEKAGTVTDYLKTVLSLGLMAPLAFCMGMPFPWALSLLHRKAVEAVPVAWAVNGFASVISTSGAVLVAMVYGFSTVLMLAAGLYALAGALCTLLGQSRAGNVSHGHG